jgi:hypothetical protein
MKTVNWEDVMPDDDFDHEVAVLIATEVFIENTDILED